MPSLSFNVANAELQCARTSKAIMLTKKHCYYISMFPHTRQGLYSHETDASTKRTGPEAIQLTFSQSITVVASQRLRASAHANKQLPLLHYALRPRLHCTLTP